LIFGYEEEGNNKDAHLEEITKSTSNPLGDSSSTFPGITMNKGNDLLLMVQHSLSQKLSIGSWDDFLSSNLQLTTIDSHKFSKRIKMNLQNRVIRVQPT